MHSHQGEEQSAFSVGVDDAAVSLGGRIRLSSKAKKSVSDLVSEDRCVFSAFTWSHFDSHEASISEQTALDKYVMLR